MALSVRVGGDTQVKGGGRDGLAGDRLASVAGREEDGERDVLMGLGPLDLSVGLAGIA